MYGILHTVIIKFINIMLQVVFLLKTDLLVKWSTNIIKKMLPILWIVIITKNTMMLHYSHITHP